eukprot:CAMPEP_0115539138 /NCGR_PEP_ID=MMETSP0271-20121206/89250_1 /TAXON_ID=71861 /ORGANISM="Scrippsiella trochoidea, Strain CCMP3099" /LENGTH=81 /DNA_ID=CAMNT_0002972077 /DNA_START=36 /DNA_END=278 /DNA_ORIENTATION=+
MAWGFGPQDVLGNSVAAVVPTEASPSKTTPELDSVLDSLEHNLFPSVSVRSTITFSFSKLTTAVGCLILACSVAVATWRSV